MELAWRCQPQRWRLCSFRTGDMRQRCRLGNRWLSSGAVASGDRGLNKGGCLAALPQWQVSRLRCWLRAAPYRKHTPQKTGRQG